MSTTQQYPPVPPVPPEPSDPPVPPNQPPKRHAVRWVLVGLGALLLTVLVLAGVLVAAVDSNSSGKDASPQAPAQSSLPSASEPSAQPSSEPPASETTSDLVVGQAATVTIDGSEAGTLTVTKVSTAAVEPGEFGSSPERGMFLVVHLSAAGTGVPFDVNPFEFSVTGSDRTHYEDATYSSAWGPEFSDTTLNTGEHTKGTLVFDVSNTAKHGKVIYAPNYDGVPLATWTY